MSRAIMIASGKGGTGKSTICINLGLSLAFKGNKVVLLDLNTGLSSLDILMSLENFALWNILDVVKENCSLDRALLECEFCPNLVLLPGTQTLDPKELDEENFSRLIEALRKDHDYILIDCPPGIGKMIELSASAVDEAIIVTNANNSALRDADALEDKLLRMGLYNRSYIINSLNYDLIQIGIELKLEDIDERMRCTLIGIIPEDNNIRASTNTGVPIVCKRDSYISDNFDKIAYRLDTMGDD